MKEWPRQLKVLQLVVFVWIVGINVYLALQGQWWSWLLVAGAAACILYLARHWSAPKAADPDGT